MGNRDATSRIPVAAQLERGLATAKLLLQYGKTPAERAKALKAIRELSRRLAMARGANGG